MPEPLLRLAFGPDLTQAADALFVLGVAMTLLAVAYLTVQYMLALGARASCGCSASSRSSSRSC